MQDQAEEVKEVQAEVVDPGTAIAKVSSAGVNVMDLMLDKDRALQVMEGRLAVVRSARSAALALTSPEDWLFFRDPEGRETGFLQDCGCDRVRDIFGIQIFNLQRPERIPPEGGEAFTYIITGDGLCKLTGQTVEAMEGGRASTDDFIVKQKEETRPKGANLELLVRKSARANLDGNITRELAGLKSVPIGEVASAWSDQPKKKIFNCRTGRGYGTDKHPGSSLRTATQPQQQNSSPRPSAQASGAQPQQQASAPDLPDYSKDYSPQCDVHNADYKLVPAGVGKKTGRPYKAFWACSVKDSDCPTFDAQEYHEKLVCERE